MIVKQRTSLTEQPIPATLFRLTYPVIVALLLLLSFNLVDTYFVSLLGTKPLAAIGFTFPLTFTIISLNIGLGIGVAAVVGRLLGSQQLGKAKDCATLSLTIGCVLVCLCSALGYLMLDPLFGLLGATDELLPLIRAFMELWFTAGIFLAIPMIGNSVLRGSGDTATPSKLMALGGIINVALDPILIFGVGPIPPMGIAGAAAATAIAWFVCAVVIVYLLRSRQLIHFHFPPFNQWVDIVGSVFKIGIPAAGANMLTPLSNGVLTKLMSTYGATAVAAWGVGNRLESIFTVVILALSMSLPPFISQNLGAGRSARIHQAYKTALFFVLLWQLILLLPIGLFHVDIARVFSDDVTVQTAISHLLLILPVGFGVQGVIVLTCSTLNALHQPMRALRLSIVRLFVFYTPMAYVGSMIYGLTGAYWGCVTANVIVAVIAYRETNQSLSSMQRAESPAT